jgi:glycosyltransferase involved in cell wall biosynthesis
MAGPRRILIVVRHPVGGIRTHLKYFYPLIHREFAGLELSLVVPRTDQAETLERDLSALPVTYVYLEPYSTPAALASSVNRELARGAFDMVHTHGFTAAAVTAPVARFRRVPHLTTLHEPLRRAQFAGFYGSVRRLALQAVLGVVDRIQAVSEDLKENLSTQLGDRIAKRVRVVPNGILTRPILEAVPRDLRAELGLAPGTLLIGFFGRFMEPKGFGYLIEAVRRLRAESAWRGTSCHVVTFGAGGYIREEQAVIEQAGLGSSFSFMPFVAEVGSALKAVDVVAIPSLWEASSLLAMEALVAGVPVVGTSCKGLSEVLAGTPATIVPVADSAALAEALAREGQSSSRGAARAFIPSAVARFDVAPRAAEIVTIMREMSGARAKRQPGSVRA